MRAAYRAALQRERPERYTAAMPPHARDASRRLPEIGWYPAGQPPQGVWERDDHRPQPVTPLFADLDLACHITRGFARADAAFGLPRRAIVHVAIGGFAYRGFPPLPWRPSAARLARLEQHVREDYTRTILRRWHTIERPRVVARQAKLRAVPLQRLSDEALLAHIRTLSAAQERWWMLHSLLATSFGPEIERARAFCRVRLDMADDEFLSLLAGASPATSGAAVRLQELARRALDEPALLAALAQDRASSDPEVQAFLAPLMDEFGDLGSDFDYSVPTLREEPARAIKLLRELVAAERSGSTPRPGAADVAGLHARLDAAGRHALDGLLEAARAAHGVRDDNTVLCLIGEGLMRYALLEAGKRGQRRGLWPRADDVLFLRRAELERWLATGQEAALPALTASRRAEWEACRIGPPPPELFGTLPPGPNVPLSEAARAALSWLPPRFRSDAEPAPQTAGVFLRGIGASAGSYRGPARLVRNEQEFERLQPGDVLVCPITTPSWNVTFGIVGAMVV
jgi:hypothetical protein